MEPFQLLDNLKALLVKNEGVAVVEAIGSKDYFRIELTASDPVSRLVIIQAAHASNIHFNVWVRYPPGSQEAISDPEQAIQYRFSTNKAYEAEDIRQSSCSQAQHSAPARAWLRHCCAISCSRLSGAYLDVKRKTNPWNKIEQSICI